MAENAATVLSVVSLTDAKVENNVLVLLNTITGKSETYPLSDRPADATSLVQYQKADVLGGIDLTRLLFELNLCGDLYDIVYNACFGIKGLHANVSSLRNRFLAALRESDIVAADFKTTTGGAIDNLLIAYGCFNEGERDVAIEVIGDVSASAAEMKEKSAKIKAIFELVLSDTQLTLNSVIGKNEELNDQFDMMRQQEADMRASYATYESLAESYKTKSGEMEEQIDDAKSELKEQEDRAYKLAIVSAVMSGVSGIAKGVGSALAKPGINIGTSTQGGSQDEESETPAQTEQTASGNTASVTRDEEGEKKYTEENNKLKALKERLAEVEKKITENDTALNEKNYGSRTETQIIEENKTLKAERDNINSEISATSSSATAVRASLEALGYAFDGTSGALSQMSEKAEAKSTTLRDDLRDLRKQKHDIDKLYADNLAKVKEMTVRLQNSVSDRKDVAVAIDSLVLAIAALHNVIAFLDMITLFWAKVEIACKSLQESNDTIKKLAEKIKSPTFFKTATFVFPYFKSFAYWVALHIIFTDYLRATDLAHDRMVESYKSNAGSREAGWDKAKGLAEALSGRIGYEIAKTGETVAALEKELKKY